MLVRVWLWVISSMLAVDDPGTVPGFSEHPPDLRAAYRHYYQGLAAYGEADFAKAEGELSRSWRAQPDNFNFALTYALCLSRLGKTEPARELLTNVQIADTDPYREHKRALMYFVQAMSLHFAGETQSAISALENGIAWQEQLGNSPMLATFHNALGYVRLHHQGKGSNHNGLGTHYHVHRRDMEKALQDFRRALDLDPTHAVAKSNWLTLADSLRQPALQREAVAVRSRGKTGPSSLVTGLPQDAPRLLDLADFDEVVILADISGSMTQEQVLCMGLSRFEVMRNLGLYLSRELPATTRLGLGTIGGDCGEPPRTWIAADSLERTDLRYAVRFLNAHGTTPMFERLKAAERLFSDDPSTSKALFLISDGANVCPEGQEDICSWAGRMRGKGITLNVVTFLDLGYNNIDAFAEYGCLADNTKGRIFYLDNVHCAFTDLSQKWMEHLLFELPKLEKVYCWGSHIESLWAIFPESDPR